MNTRLMEICTSQSPIPRSPRSFSILWMNLKPDLTQDFVHPFLGFPITTFRVGPSFFLAAFLPRSVSLCEKTFLYHAISATKSRRAWDDVGSPHSRRSNIHAYSCVCMWINHLCQTRCTRTFHAHQCSGWPSQLTFQRTSISSPSPVAQIAWSLTPFPDSPICHVLIPWKICYL